jgi:hypothetical protein
MVGNFRSAGKETNRITLGQHLNDPGGVDEPRDLVKLLKCACVSVLTFERLNARLLQAKCADQQYYYPNTHLICVQRAKLAA